MKKTLINIGITLSFLFVLFSSFAVYAAVNPDYEGQIKMNLQQAKASEEAAKKLSCAYIGRLTEACYSKKGAACGKLEAAENAYELNFNGAIAYDECFTHDTSTDPTEESEQPAPIPPAAQGTDSTPDSLLFGDEAGN